MNNFRNGLLQWPHENKKSRDFGGYNYQSRDLSHGQINKLNFLFFLLHQPPCRRLPVMGRCCADVVGIRLGWAHISVYA